MNRIWLAVWSLVSVAGCSSLRGPHVEYDAPRVTGRVVDNSTGQPIRRAAVQRWLPPDVKSSSEPERGVMRLRSRFVTHTDELGRFVLPARRSVYLLFAHDSAAFDTAISIQHPRYAGLVTNLTGAKRPAQAKSGPPEITTGDIRLTPKH